MQQLKIENNFTLEDFKIMENIEHSYFPNDNITPAEEEIKELAKKYGGNVERKSIMIDMDEVIVKGRFTEFLDEFLGEVDFEKLNGFFRQDLIKGREEEFKEIYQFKNLYKKDDGLFVEPLPNCVETIKKLNEYYDIYIVTSYIWKEDVIDAAHNLKYKYEYLKHFLPFVDSNNFIFISDKNKMKFDIGIDDRPGNLKNCDKKLLFTEFRNEKLTQEELDKDNLIRVNNWLEVQGKLI